MDAIVPFLRVNRPVISDQSFHPGRLDGSKPLVKIRVKILDIPGGNRHFTAVLRCAEFIPPPVGCLFHNTPLYFKAGLIVCTAELGVSYNILTICAMAVI